jgi:hypothetical protein
MSRCDEYVEVSRSTRPFLHWSLDLESRIREQDFEKVFPAERKISRRAKKKSTLDVISGSSYAITGSTRLSSVMGA